MTTQSERRITIVTDLSLPAVRRRWHVVNPDMPSGFWSLCGRPVIGGEPFAIQVDDLAADGVCGSCRRILTSRERRSG